MYNPVFSVIDPESTSNFSAGFDSDVELDFENLSCQLDKKERGKIGATPIEVNASEFSELSSISMGSPLKWDAYIIYNLDIFANKH